MPGHKPADIIKLETKRHILTDESGITPSANITSVNTHEVIVARDIVDSILSDPHLPTSSKISYLHGIRRRMKICWYRATSR